MDYINIFQIVSIKFFFKIKVNLAKNFDSFNQPTKYNVFLPQSYDNIIHQKLKFYYTILLTTSLSTLKLPNNI